VLVPLVSALLLQLDAGPSSFALRMREPAQREAAACEAYAVLQSNEFEACAVNHVLETQGPRGRPVFLVFFAHGFDGEDAGVPVGHFEVFDEFSRHLVWAGNANVLGPRDVVLQPTTGPAFVAQAGLYGAPCADAASLQGVQVISLADPGVPLLAVIAGPPSRETRVERTSEPTKPYCMGDVCVGPISGQWLESVFSWSWAARCRANACELTLGPVDGGVAARYRWRAGARRIDGPWGAPDGGFLRLRLEDEWRGISAFSAAHDPNVRCP